MPLAQTLDMVPALSALLARLHSLLPKLSWLHYPTTLQQHAINLRTVTCAHPHSTDLLRVEVRVYVQKVKHLEYEHQGNLKSIAMDGQHLLGGEADLHG